MSQTRGRADTAVILHSPSRLFNVSPVYPLLQLNFFLPGVDTLPLGVWACTAPVGVSGPGLEGG